MARHGTNHTLNREPKKMRLDVIRKMSLRTRLAMLAVFALVSLLVALFIAWRLARTTEMFALRQANSSLHAAARDLARAVHAYPSGYQTMEETVTRPAGSRPVPSNKSGKNHPVPPHVKTLFAAYADPLSRLTAITLHRFPETYGGFYRAADNSLAGQAFPANAGTGTDTAFPPEVIDVIRTLAKQAGETGEATARTIQAGSDRILIVAYPTVSDSPEFDYVSTEAEGVSLNPVSAAWSMQRLSTLTGVSDIANLAALALLILCIIVVSGLSLLTIRDLRSGVTGIEEGLTALTKDLNQQVLPPSVPELSRITVAINHLADTLRLNLARQSELEHDLRRNEQLSALGRLTAGVAHEVRNPLAAIKLKVQMARRSKNAPDKLDDTFRVITEEIDRLDGLVRRLLEFGRTKPLEQNELDLCEIVRQRAALFNDVAERAGIKIAVNVSPEPVLVTGDGERLAQVLDNLTSNALSAMPEGGQLTVSCQPAIDRDGLAVARLTVEDTGRGIAPEDQERIFEPFYTASESGTGLGLAIAREIVEAHGGRLNYVSRTAPGALFLIEVPHRAESKNNKQVEGHTGVDSGEKR
jgi:signal transduction histidine kinase